VSTGDVLTIRTAQLQALGAGRLEALRRQVTASLRLRHRDLVAALPASYLDELVTASFTACREHGHNQAFTLAEFAESMLKDDRHPLAPTEMHRKLETILRDLDARARFTRLQAVKAATATKKAGEP
jgi:hypothetical protein